MQKKIRHIILDLDQTITIDQGSWLQFTSLLGANPQIHLDIFNRYKDGKLDYVSAKKALIGHWKTVHPLNKDGISALFDKIELRDGVIEAVNYLKTKYNIVIISGAINTFVEIIAKKFGIKHYYTSTKFLFDKDNILYDFEYSPKRGEDKVKFLEEYLNKISASSDECSAIGDGDSDMQLFDVVRLPILFISSETTIANKEKVELHLNDWKDISKYL